MLSTTQERKLRFVRGTLVFGWLLLIVSLFCIFSEEIFAKVGVGMGAGEIRVTESLHRFSPCQIM